MPPNENQDVIDQILQGGVGPDLKSQAKLREQALEQTRLVAAQFKACFATPAGVAVLEHLRSITIEQPCFVPGTELNGDGLAAAQQGFLREGQNSLVREIVRLTNWKDPEA